MGLFSRFRVHADFAHWSNLNEFQRPFAGRPFIFKDNLASFGNFRCELDVCNDRGAPSGAPQPQSSRPLLFGLPAASLVVVQTPQIVKGRYAGPPRRDLNSHGRKPADLQNRPVYLSGTPRVERKYCVVGCRNLLNRRGKTIYDLW